MASEHPEIQNEALRLYEFNIEDEFHRKGTVAQDSSLGALPDPQTRTTGGDEGERKH